MRGIKGWHRRDCQSMCSSSNSSWWERGLKLMNDFLQHDLFCVALYVETRIDTMRNLDPEFSLAKENIQQ